MNVSLINVRADGEQHSVTMKRDRLVIGRSDGADVRIPVASVSREHCEIVSKGGALALRDLGSSNGTYVNKKRVQEATLNAGDLIGIGPAVFVVQVNGEPATINAARFFEEGAAPMAMSTTTPAAPTQRPAQPAAVKPAASASSSAKPSASPGAAPAKKKSLLDDDDDEFDIGPGASGSGSFADIDFDLDDDEDDEPKSPPASGPGPGKKK